MKVVFLTTIPSPYRVAFFNEWGKHCELTIIFERNSSDDRDETWKNVIVENFKPVFLKGININANKAFCPSIIKTIKKLQFDVFIVGGYNTPTAMLATEWLKRRNIPYILNADGGYIKEDSFIVERIKKHYISGASMWICTSEKTIEYFLHYGAKQDFIRKYPFTSLHKKDILEYPISSNEKWNIRKTLGITEDKMILSVGQFIYRKGFDILLKAKKQLPDNVGLYIIGGNETSEYKEIVDDLGLSNVHFIPFMHPKVLAEYYKAADVFAFPTREDIWGLVINEAAAYGLPIVTTNECIAGLEIIDDCKNGFIIKGDDVNSLANRINELFNDKELALAFSKGLINTAKHYTYEEMAQRHLRIVEEFVKLHEVHRR